MNNKKLTIIAAIIVIAILSVYFFGNKQSGTIKIGALYPLTGGLASYGEPALKSAEIAVADINAKGGINGKKLELIVGNHRCDPKETVSTFNKIQGVDDINIFTSVACTGAVASIIPQLQERDVVLLATVTSGNKLTGISPNFYRNWASDKQEAKLLLDEMVKNGYKNVAVIYEETDYAKGLKLSMEEYLKGTDVKITGESFASGSMDVRSQITKLASIKPDAVFISVQTVTSGEIVLAQMEQLKFRPSVVLVNDNILKASVLLKSHSTILEGAIGGDYVIATSSDLDSVLAKYKSKYGEDCPQINICAAEYDAIALLAKAIENKGNTANGVKEYLGTATYEGVSGTISFDSNNDRSDAAYSLFVIRDGKAVLLK